MNEKLYQEIYKEVNNKNVEELNEKLKKYEIKELKTPTDISSL